MDKGTASSEEEKKRYSNGEAVAVGGIEIFFGVTGLDSMDLMGVDPEERESFREGKAARTA